jgi:hypothetical protein
MLISTDNFQSLKLSMYIFGAKIIITSLVIFIPSEQLSALKTPGIIVNR